MSKFDINKVLSIVDNDKGMAKTLLEMTLELGTIDFNEMKKLTSDGEFDAAGKLAHKLKSSLATLGFTSISEQMKDLEHYSKTNVEASVFEDKMSKLEVSTAELFDFIRQALASDLK